MAEFQPNYEAAADRIEAMQGQGAEQSRSTSAAKDYAPPAHEFDNVPELGPAMDQAQAAEQPLEQRPQPTPPSITAAKEIDPGGLEGTAMDNAPELGESFEGAQGEPVNDNAPQTEGQQEEGSKMVKDDQPTPEPSNTTLEAEIVDREQFDQAWEQEQMNAEARQEAAIEAAAERIEEMESDRDRGQEMGMG